MSEGHTIVYSSLDELPKSGYLRRKQFVKLLPFSFEKFRQMSDANQAPKAVRMTQRLSIFKAEEIHRFCNNPANYKP